MKKKQIIICTAILLCMIGVLTIVVVLNWTKNNDKISKELAQAQATFHIELSADQTEYIIYGLKSTANKSGATIVIPDTIDGIPVTQLIDNANQNFSKFNRIQQITIGKNVRYIGTSITPQDLDDYPYGKNIFSGATALVSINVHPENQVFSAVDGVLYNKDQTILIKYPMAKTETQNQSRHIVKVANSVKSIYQKAFYQHPTLEGVVLENVNDIGAEAFANCLKLSQLDLGANIKKIESKGFENCTALSNVDLPMGIVSVGSLTFSHCTKLARIVIPNTLIDFGYAMLPKNENLKIYTTVDFKKALIEKLLSSSTFQDEETIEKMILIQP
ncbi:MAG: leucine-rich repeat domain-containing protein [Prevotella sp.]|nr:leucine-rich repeat domain-containing protein [Staphylococcus sp.]MCM1349641.1 leucine-rich repeat domain-containing protein [Prevotella sp.]